MVHPPRLRSIGAHSGGVERTPHESPSNRCAEHVSRVDDDHGRSIPSAYDEQGRRRRVDQSRHGFDTSGRDRPKPLSRTRVESVASAPLPDDN